ncbi:hypothetical protein PSV3_00269 [Septimatrevirus PSV33]|uniref:Uncharacterized protein n=1 Tax=Pseudomonas phage PSV3 TaxID=3003632 RepID=A0AAE9VX42_9CAUD|nr:hypothetical protein PM406_gp70 [Pseudomonas phage PSV3]WBF76971.1 hypothetical protein PSV3_00269 [Pseudomonas phage PSV3]
MYEIETGHKMPKQRRKAGSVPKAVQQAFNDYAEAYKAVYGVRPLSFTYDRESRFIRVERSGGVSVARLREMTKQLRYRKG